MIYDSDAATLAWRRTPYPIEVTQEKMQLEGLPPRLARRLGGTCIVVTVQADATPSSLLMRYRVLATQLGASFAVLGGTDVAAAVIQAARDSAAEHVVVGEMITYSVFDRLRSTVVDRIIDQLPTADVHVIARLAR